MSEPTPEVTPQPTPQPEAKPESRFTQEQVNALLAEQKRKAGEKFADYGSLKAKADRLDAIEEKNKTDLQKEQERATAAEQRAVASETKALRAEVALDKGVPLILLAGTTREELEANADALLAFRGDTKPAVVKALKPGAGSSTERSVAAGAEMFAARKKPSTTTP